MAMWEGSQAVLFSKKGRFCCKTADTYRRPNKPLIERRERVASTCGRELQGAGKINSRLCPKQRLCNQKGIFDRHARKACEGAEGSDAA